MKKIISSIKIGVSLIIVSCVYKSSFAQLVITPGVYVTSRGSTTQIVLTNTSLVNNGTIDHASGTIKFSGSSTNSIAGHGTLNFYNLELAKSTGISLSLSNNIGIKNRLIFSSGLLNLNNNNIDLFSTGLLINENETNRIIGSNGGRVKITVNLNAPSSANPGNLGAILSSVENLGSVVIQRGHQSQINDQGTGSSILRYYDIDPTNNFNLKATLRFRYFDAELNGISETDLVLFKGAANGSWVEKGFTSKDAALNYVEKINNPDFSRWTVSNFGNSLANACPDGLPGQTYYADADGDGYGNNGNTVTACSQPEGYVTNKTDCNDRDPSVHPGATETCNGFDDDCDGLIDEGVRNTYYPDVDKDGYGNSSLPVQSCMAIDNYVSVGGDCNDNNGSVHPGATEICGNFIDDDCDGQTDEECPSSNPSISIYDITVNESQGMAQVTVSLSAPSPNTIRVSFRTVNGTASHPKDYARNTGEIAFAPGNTIQTIDIPIIADNKAEPDEYFDVQLHTPIGAIISDNTGTVTITEGLLTRLNTSGSKMRENNNNDHFDVRVSNNPTHTQFRLDIETNKEETIAIQVSDVQGRIIQRIQANHPFQPVYLGTGYRPGVYFAQVMQGTSIKTVKLIKF